MPKKDKETSQLEPQQFMLGSLISMGWQLAVAVLVPLLGGNLIDRTLGTLPWFTLVGMILAMAGMIVVVRHALKDVNRYVEETKETKDPS